MTAIAFLGSVFSPHYAAARARGRAADPLDHACLNVHLAGPGGRWAMTERPRAAVAREATSLRIGPSALHWSGDVLTITVDERASPLPHPVRGTIRVRPRGLTGAGAHLDDSLRHRWRPIAPSCRVEVAFDAPAQRWSGEGYLDSNDGDAPLEQDFRRWDWARVGDGAGRVAILYDTFPRAGAGRALAFRLGAGGSLEPFTPPPRQPLAPSLWRLPRFARGAARVERTLLDAPFYARSAIETRLDGGLARGVAESIDLDRFRSPLVQAMLHARAPRGGVRRSRRSVP